MTSSRGGREDCEDREVRGVFTAKPKTPDSDHYRRLFDKEAVMGPEIDDRWRR